MEREINMGVIIFLIAFGVLTMWYALHVIIYKNYSTVKNILFFTISSIILYIILSYCFVELLKYKI